jgi:hypothetical protein
MKMAVFWVVAPYGLAEIYRRFRGSCCLIRQGIALDIVRIPFRPVHRLSVFLKSFTLFISRLLFVGFLRGLSIKIMFIFTVLPLRAIF